MPLGEYGVAIGGFGRFWRDNSDDFGRFMHGHISIRIPNGRGLQDFEAAVDVNKPDGAIEYFHPTNLDATKFATVAALADGYHRLASNNSSGALDYKRGELISAPLGCLGIFLVVLNWFTGGSQKPWTTNNGTEALDHLEAMFSDPGTVAKVYLFGAPFPLPYAGIPQGVHDVHCNQGDPPGPYQHLDGIWQDGGVIVKYADGHLEGFFVKFSTQTLNTNDQGLPI